MLSHKIGELNVSTDIFQNCSGGGYNLSVILMSLIFSEHNMTGLTKSSHGHIHGHQSMINCDLDELSSNATIRLNPLTNILF